MPHVEPTWRIWPQWRLVSRALCFFGCHHWMMSRTIKKPIACAVCSKKTKYMEQYQIAKSMKQDP
jgi:hypothetical protein